MPYILELTYDIYIYIYEVDKAGEHIKGYTISKHNKPDIKLLCIEWDYQTPV